MRRKGLGLRPAPSALIPAHLLGALRVSSPFLHGLKIKKPAQGWFLLFCGEKDLNLHGITSISPSS